MTPNSASPQKTLFFPLEPLLLPLAGIYSAARASREATPTFWQFSCPEGVVDWARFCLKAVFWANSCPKAIFFVALRLAFFRQPFVLSLRSQSPSPWGGFSRGCHRYCFPRAAFFCQNPWFMTPNSASPQKTLFFPLAAPIITLSGYILCCARLTRGNIHFLAVFLSRRGCGLGKILPKSRFLGKLLPKSHFFLSHLRLAFFRQPFSLSLRSQSPSPWGGFRRGCHRYRFPRAAFLSFSFSLCGRLFPVARTRLISVRKGGVFFIVALSH